MNFFKKLKLHTSLALTRFFSKLGIRKRHYLFAYFHNNCDGKLYYAHSTDGLKWEYLADGFLKADGTTGHCFRDPFIYKGREEYICVWTASAPHGIGFSKSKDLVHWDSPRFIPVMQSLNGCINCWAPEVIYDEGRYIIFWSSTVDGKHSFVSSSDDESIWNHRIYYCTTEDFDTFTEPQFLFNPNFNVIDATLFKHKGDYHLFVKNENSKPYEKNIRVVKGGGHVLDGFAPEETSEPITKKAWAEGPTCLSLPFTNILYYDYYCAGKIGASISSNLEDWMNVDDLVTFPHGVRHGNAFQISDSEYKNIIKELNRS